MSANQSTIRIVLDAAEAQAGAKTLNTELSNIGASGKAAGAAATAGLNQVETSSRAATLSVKQLEEARWQELLALTANVKVEKYVATQYTEAERQRSQAIQQAAAATGNATLAAAQRRAALVNESIALKQAEIAGREKTFSDEAAAVSAMRIAAVEREKAAAVAASAAADVEAAGAASLTTRQMVQLGTSVDRIAGVAIPGARSLGILSGALTSGVGLGSLVAIAGVSLLIGELIKLVSQAGKTAEITKDLIETDIILASVFDRLAKSGNDVDGSLQRQADSYRKMIAADISGLLTTYVQQYAKLSATQKEAQADDERSRQMLAFVNQERAKNIDLTKLGIDAGGEYSAIQQGLANSTAKEVEEQGKQEKTVNATVEALLAANRAGVITTDTMYAMARAAGADANAIAFLKGEIEKATNAQEELNAAARNFKPAGLDTKAQESVVEKMRENIVLMRNQGATLAQLTPAMKELRQESAKLAVEQASSAGHIMKFNEAQEATKKVMAGSYESIIPLADALGIYDKNVKTATEDTDKHTKAHHAGAAAAHAHATAENELTKRLLESQAALEGDSFSQKGGKIEAEADAARQKLVIDAKYSKEKAKTLTEDILYVNQIEVNQQEAVNRQRFEAIQKNNNEIEKMQIQGLATEEERRRATIDLEIKERSEANKKLFGDTVLADEQTTNYSRALWSGYYRWKGDMERKAAEERHHVEIQLENTLDEERLKRDKKTMDEAVKRFKDLEAARHTIAGQIGGSFINPADKVAVAAIKTQIDQLTASFKGLNSEEARTSAVFKQVAAVFGFVSSNARVLQLQLKTLQQISDGNIFGGLLTSLEAIGEEFLLTGGLAHSMADAFQGAFSQMIENGGNFISTFGKLLLGGMLQILGQLAIQVGTYYLLEGIAALFDPFTTANAAGLIAGGTALIAFGAGLAAAGSAISSSARNTRQQQTAAGTGAAAGTGPVNAPPSQGSPPKVISFPTSGPLNSQQPLIIQLDRNLSNDLVNGKQVVTMPMVRNATKSTELGRKIGKLAS